LQIQELSAPKVQRIFNHKNLLKQFERIVDNRFMLTVILCILALSAPTDDQIVAAICRAENSVKYPYGIKSINTHGDKEYARRICLNTIRNNRRRWQAAGRPGDYIDYLADRYVPKSVDPQGNINWKRNVKFFLKN